MQDQGLARDALGEAELADELCGEGADSWSWTALPTILRLKTSTKR